MRLEPTTLDGRDVRLEPLALGHHADLCEVGLDEELWRLAVSPVRTPDEMRAYIERALAEQAAGAALPFAMISKATGRAVGSARFANISVADRRVEIGATWLGRAYQRTALNTEAKYLMLRHAFEVFDCLRVELKTDVLNQRSRAAILRLGAIEEGVLRQHMVTASGRVRDSVYYSILDTEWPRVRAGLETKMARGDAGGGG